VSRVGAAQAAPHGHMEVEIGHHVARVGRGQQEGACALPARASEVRRVILAPSSEGFVQHGFVRSLCVLPLALSCRSPPPLRPVREALRHALAAKRLGSFVEQALSLRSPREESLRRRRPYGFGDRGKALLPGGHVGRGPPPSCREEPKPPAPHGKEDLDHLVGAEPAAVLLLEVGNHAFVLRLTPIFAEKVGAEQVRDCPVRVCAGQNQSRLQ